ncbi:4'-phosphopantetheinyl transferase superfamily protein [Geomonas sp. RF6]|uniref:4'-phosphopantetheinyl transferase family protein n=1 Tax=Geomonas sp. RF6 TaxID=2897342 RepID=UPI001E477D1C|nr:4'-phosphopantetheinyl transferase superfamily protein [Geomonas sp. RF6]UFS70037.1 4'-phosphopantetheinyl transferase superfamily protein [Geomonas sp. RF6]
MKSAPPEPGAVHLWRGNLAADASAIATFRQHLSPDEDLRAARLIDQEKRRRFIAGRGIVREVLSSYLGIHPRSLRLDVTAHGKPFLSDAATDLRFNTSHSGDLILTAVTTGREVGVDLELVRQDLDFAPMARSFFSASEQRDLFTLPPSEQLDAFYRCWTRKEAYLKGTGSGFSQRCDLFDVTLLPGFPAALVSHRTAPEEASTWRLADLSVPPGYCAALAVEGEIAEVRSFTHS